jgi:glycerate kinase
VAFLGARIVSGFDVVAEATGLEARLAAADIVATAEGRSIASRGRARPRAGCGRWPRPGKGCVVFAGTADVADEYVLTLASLEPDAGRSMEHAAKLLERLAREWGENQPS